MENYCIGTGENDSFCWWIERGLKPLGYYSPGSSRSYLIYWSDKKQDYSLHGHGLFKNMDSETAMKDIAIVLSEVLKSKNVEQGNKYFGDSFLLKVLNSYYPNEFFPTNGEKHLNSALKIFGIDATKMSRPERNKKLNELFLAKKQEFNVDITSFEFSRFLFSNFNLKTGEDIDKNDVVVANGETQIIQFHPAYSYEDFVRGISVKTNDNNQIEYTVENRTLTKFAQKAIDNPNGNYVLIIDEINRANLPSVLGELIYALEYRGELVESMYALKIDGEDSEESTEFILPKNLYIIGTMNTADRSVGHIDYAIRRRFAFVDVPPTDKAIDDVITDVVLRKKAKDLYFAVSELFSKENLASDFQAKDVQLGHSYFLVQKEKDLELKLKYEIIPILQEYLKDGILLESVKSKIEALNV